MRFLTLALHIWPSYWLPRQVAVLVLDAFEGAAGHRFIVAQQVI